MCQHTVHHSTLLCATITPLLAHLQQLLYHVIRHVEMGLMQWDTKRDDINRRHLPVRLSALLPLLFLFSLYFRCTPPLPRRRKRTHPLHHDASLTLSVLSPCAGIGRKSIPLSSTTPSLPFFSSIPVLLPLPAAKCAFWTGHKRQHNISPYRSRHKEPRAHCLSVSAGSSYVVLFASAKPRKHIRDHKQDNRVKTGVATKIIFWGKMHL